MNYWNTKWHYPLYWENLNIIDLVVGYAEKLKPFIEYAFGVSI